MAWESIWLPWWWKWSLESVSTPRSLKEVVFSCTVGMRNPGCFFPWGGSNSGLNNFEFHEVGGAQTMNGIYVRLKSETVVHGLCFVKNICHQQQEADFK